METWSQSITVPPPKDPGVGEFDRSRERQEYESREAHRNKFDRILLVSHLEFLSDFLSFSLIPLQSRA